MGEDLGIGFGYEFIAAPDEILLEGAVIFDNAVVHHNNGAIAVKMRVGVRIRGASVRGPPGMSDSNRPGKRKAAVRQLL